jgi:signal transduction histidine kinase
MALNNKSRAPALLAALAALLGILVWTEIYVWKRVDRLRDDGSPVTQAEVESFHRMQTWSSVVLLAVGGALAVLLYRGVIVPLQSRLRQSQRVIERQEKLSSLGVLAAGVAHEIRNPLTSIKARLYTQQSLLEEKSEALEDNVFITGEISRLEKIVADFLAFARPSEPQMVTLKATQPFRDLEGLFSPALTKANIGLRKEFLADPQIKADPAQLKQVLINLVQNAAESMGRGGTITLRTRTQKRHRATHPTTVAVLEVEDTGPGIPPEVQKRLFDPFFTTKAGGTGLGLSIAARILEKHGGTLEYQPAPKRGAIFRLTLPLAATEA